MASVVCSGPHLTGLAPILGTADTLTADPGMLCTDCGLVYAASVSDNSLQSGMIPDADKIAKVLAVIKPTYDKTSYKPPKVKP